MPPTTTADRSGLLLGAGAYGLWGFLPLYFPLLAPAGPVEIIAHRVVWSLLFCVAILLVGRTWRAALATVRQGRMLALLALAGVLVATNWLVFVAGVLGGHTVDAALGYYINPLVTVGLAVLVLGERLRPAQWVAIAIGGLAVLVLTIGVGRLPWIALTLAFTFGLYGLIKNRVGRTVPALASLAVETAFLAPAALVYLAVLGSAGDFATHGAWHGLALAGTGVVTAVPLLLFGGAARRLPLNVVGLLQYLTPTLQFAVGLLVFHEPMSAIRWWGFGLVWVALVVLTVDTVRAGGPTLRARQPATVSQ